MRRPHLMSTNRLFIPGSVPSLRARSLSIVVGMACIASVSMACGKKRLDPAQEEELLSHWDPPTAANGFHAIAPVLCTQEDATTTTTTSSIPSVTNGTLEAVAILSDEDRQRGRYIGGVAVDHHTVYWTRRDSSSGTILRASRADGRLSWVVEPVAAGEIDPGDIALGDRFAYWTASSINPNPTRESIAGVRYFDKETSTIGSLATETQRPTRLVADGRSVFWIAPPNHVREAKDNGAPHDILALSALNPDLLAVDHVAVYAFTDQTLIRIPRNGGAPVVLVSSTITEPADVRSDEGKWVYWLERGPVVERCASLPCGCNYGHVYPRPRGSLRRVPAGGGAVEVVATDLPDVEKLAIHHGIAWITTGKGLLRVDPSRASSRYFVEEGANTSTRPTTIGDALVFATRGSHPQVALLSRP